MIFKVHFILFLLSIAFAIDHDLHAQTDNSPQGRILFIFDGSGSMWGRVDSRPKIDIARQAISNLINELPADIEIGLQIYGHRVKGDCNDIEMAVPVGQGSRDALLDKIKSISPKGKTPISQSIQLAADKLKQSEEETTIVLISDGKESCGGAPCKLVKTLKELGIKVTIHVVGFDVNQEERDELICIAETGGGKYFTANNTFQLVNTFKAIEQQIVNKKCNTRNPFCVRDVPNPFDAKVKAYARRAPTKANKKDPNAHNWPASKIEPGDDTVEGYWRARWNGGGARSKWIDGTAEIRVVQNTVYILYKDRTSTYLTEAKIQNNNRLVGKYVNINNPRDSTPWTGIIIDNKRIDGHWAKGRWDYRR
jgi:hypothetical protein